MRIKMSKAWGRLAMLTAVAGCTAVVMSGCGEKPMPLTPDQQMAVSKADPQMQVVLDQLHKDGAKSFSMLTVEQARSGPTAQMAAMQVAQKMNMTTPEPVGGVGETSMSGRDGNNVSLLVYTPTGKDTGPYPVLVYFHGGGWVVGDLRANPYDASCRALCNKAHCVVVSVDYRLAPENPYPAAVNDCYDAFQYVASHADKFKGDGKHVAVAGESAGGNLAVAVSLMAVDQHAMLPSTILSIYPVGGYYTDTASAKENALAIPLDTPSLVWFYEKYVPTMANRSARYFDIDKADLHGLPMTTVITDQIDPLHDDGVMLADNLRQAGVQMRYMNYDGVTHEFFGMAMVVDKSKDAQTFAVDGLNMGFGRTPGMSGTSGMPGM